MTTKSIILECLDREELKGLLREVLSEMIPVQSKETGKEHYLTRNEVAKILKISLVTLHEWTLSGKITGYRMGRGIRFKESEIENVLVRMNTGLNKWKRQ